jgi:hypothetical protein
MSAIAGGATMVTGDRRFAKSEYRQRRLKLLDGFRLFFAPVLAEIVTEDLRDA